jgi:predicted transcriptional regulator
MNEFTKLPEAELEIMMIIWESGQNVTSDYIMEKLNGKKTWGRTTVLNFLTRLVDRGFLTISKEGRFNIYSPLVAQQEYLEQESKSFLEKMYQNSVKKLVATLYNSKNISKDDLEELKRFIEEAE